MNNIRAFFFTMICVPFLGAFAQVKTGVTENIDFSLYDSFLNNNYQRGSYLVYDCAEKHWVCTGKNEFNRCKRIRKKAVKDNKQQLPCGMIKSFGTEKNCQKYQLKVTSRSDYSRFCFHDQYRNDHKSY